MDTIRASLRLILFTCWTFALYLVRLIRRTPAGRAWVYHNWARGVARITGMCVSVEGRAPSRPFLLVSNHLSYVDIVLLAGQLDCIFVAKRDVRSWPVLGLMIESMDTIFVDRDNRKDLVRVNAEIDSALSAGNGVVLFAEGTSTRGDRVLPLKPSLLDLAAQRNFPVSHATITYSAPQVCWYGDMTFPGHFFDLLKLPHFAANLVFGDEPVRETDRKRLAHRLHQRIEEKFTPVMEDQ
jgi:1-acyl-sn-glycerol-3-phosphate acyltransferase